MELDKPAKRSGSQEVGKLKWKAFAFISFISNKPTELTFCIVCSVCSGQGFSMFCLQEIENKMYII